MNAPKVVMIGAGSASFGPVTLAALASERALNGGQIVLVDLNEGALEDMERLGQSMSANWGSRLDLTATVDRCEALPGADFVIVSTEVPPREKLWRQDWEIPLQYGLRQPYAENGGPGGLIHAFRQIPPILEIAKDMEKHCPEALLINFSNPLPRVTRAVTKYSKIRVVGKCHQIQVGYALATVLLAGHFGFEVPQLVRFHAGPGQIEQTERLAELGRRHFRIMAAGLNHFTWITEIRDRESGDDLYPILRAAADRAPGDFEPLSMELFRIFGLCPVPGDTHVCEYLPWVHDQLAEPWQRYDLRLYDWSGNEARRANTWRMIADATEEAELIEQLRRAPSEGAAELIAAICTNEPLLDEAVNVPNGEAILGLPADTIVELPAMISGSGIRPLSISPFPPSLTELLRREAALVELVVDAAVRGDRSLALQALLLDPMINDIERAKDILRHYLEANRAQLPQFNEQG